MVTFTIIFFCLVALAAFAGLMVWFVVKTAV